MKMTEIQDDACFRGTFKSILLDSKYSDEISKPVFDKIINKTTGNETFIEPKEVSELTREMFNQCEVKKGKEVSEILNEGEKIDNENSFGAIFLKGNSNGQNRHVARVISRQENGFVLMNPTDGKIRPYSAEELQGYSPEGFAIVVMKK